MKVDVILADLGNSFFLVLKPLVVIASIIKETLRRGTSVSDSAHYFNKTNLFSGNKDIDHILA
jgi:hypothetical protein